MISGLSPRLKLLTRPSVESRGAAQPIAVREKPVLSEVLSHSRLPALDGLRAVGVATVVVGHVVAANELPGDFGPTAFFVLSGFLITRLLLREREKTGSVSVPRFYLARTLRIFPAYYAFLLLSYLLDARVGQVWSSTFLTSAVTYTVNYFNAFNHHPTTSLAHAWSLAVEEQFYLLWGVAFAILAARGRRALLIGVGAAALAGIAWRIWLVLGVKVDASYVYNAFETRFDNLAVGCLMAITLDYNRVLAAAEWCGKRKWFPIITLLLLLVSRTVLPGKYHYSIGFTIDALLIAVLIVQLLQLYRSRLWSWLEWPAMRYLGAISYPMYLYHAWGGSVGRRLPGDVVPLEVVAGFLATIVLAAGSYHLIELPFLKLRPRRKPVSPATALAVAAETPVLPAAVMIQSA